MESTKVGSESRKKGRTEKGKVNPAIGNIAETVAEKPKVVIVDPERCNTVPRGTKRRDLQGMIGDLNPGESLQYADTSRAVTHQANGRHDLVVTICGTPEKTYSLFGDSTTYEIARFLIHGRWPDE